jgi:hypothetical protein
MEKFERGFAFGLDTAAGCVTPPHAPDLVPAAPANDARERAPKSRASVPETAVHDALSVIDDGGAVAFDLTLPAEHYFRPRGATVEERLLAGLSDLAPGACDALAHAFGTTPLLFALREAFLLLQAQAEASPARETLLSRRFVVVHAGHVLFDAGLILEHAGSQARSGRGPGRPTIYLPLGLLALVQRGSPTLREDLRHLLEHADFHLRGEPDAVVVGDHPFSSAEQHAHIEHLWSSHRGGLIDACQPALQRVDADAGAYWGTVLYLLGAVDLVMADDVPMLLQRIESTGAALAAFIPQLHATLHHALCQAPPAACFKLVLFESTGRSVSSLLARHALTLPPELRALLERPSAGVLAMRRTPAPAALAQLADELRALGGRSVGAEALVEAQALLDEFRAACPEGEDLRRAVRALGGSEAGAGSLAQVAEDHLLNQAEGEVLGLAAACASGEVTRRHMT